ncbi:hypothetical protein JAAARDRAFT_211067 [Jaapia argillacea MUCL 33604]|uniref:Uncharacterized protein n=1 Tax=Jaapia argillacea MUCL 33604 TaxID=933084 RepID=A0A067PM91_9AGAM|nr:hypothetical protein JAAARDRAFT_211067 [Jaapia argillacea MUCL 33604]
MNNDALISQLQSEVQMLRTQRDTFRTDLTKCRREKDSLAIALRSEIQDLAIAKTALQERVEELDMELFDLRGRVNGGLVRRRVELVDRGCQVGTPTLEVVRSRYVESAVQAVGMCVAEMACQTVTIPEIVYSPKRQYVDGAVQVDGTAGLSGPREAADVSMSDVSATDSKELAAPSPTNPSTLSTPPPIAGQVHTRTEVMNRSKNQYVDTAVQVNALPGSSGLRISMNSVPVAGAKEPLARSFRNLSTLPTPASTTSQATPRIARTNEDGIRSTGTVKVSANLSLGSSRNKSSPNQTRGPAADSPNSVLGKVVNSPVPNSNDPSLRQSRSWVTPYRLCRTQPVSSTSTSRGAIIFPAGVSKARKASCTSAPAPPAGNSSVPMDVDSDTNISVSQEHRLSNASAISAQPNSSSAPDTTVAAFRNPPTIDSSTPVIQPKKVNVETNQPPVSPPLSGSRRTQPSDSPSLEVVQNPVENRVSPTQELPSAAGRFVRSKSNCAAPSLEHFARLIPSAQSLSIHQLTAKGDVPFTLVSYHNPYNVDPDSKVKLEDTSDVITSGLTNILSPEPPVKSSPPMPMPIDRQNGVSEPLIANETQEGVAGSSRRRTFIRKRRLPTDTQASSPPPPQKRACITSSVNMSSSDGQSREAPRDAPITSGTPQMLGNEPQPPTGNQRFPELHTLIAASFSRIMAGNDIKLDLWARFATPGDNSHYVSWNLSGMEIWSANAGAGRID